MTELRKRMLEELQRRNFSPTTIRYYVRVVEDFARYFGKRPDRLTAGQMRTYHLHLIQNRKLAPKTVRLHIAALRFFFVKTLRRPNLKLDLPYPKAPVRLPTVLSSEEIARLIDSAKNLLDYTMLLTLYATGMRRAELIGLKVEDIDSSRMIVHIRQGKGRRDRDVPLTPRLLNTLREYWQWMKPKTYLFPGMVDNWRADKPLTSKCVWIAVQDAAKRAGIQKRVSPHYASAYEYLRVRSKCRCPLRMFSLHVTNIFVKVPAHGKKSEIDSIQSPLRRGNGHLESSLG